MQDFEAKPLPFHLMIAFDHQGQPYRIYNFDDRTEVYGYGWKVINRTGEKVISTCNTERLLD